MIKINKKYLIFLFFFFIYLFLWLVLLGNLQPQINRIRFRKPIVADKAYVVNPLMTENYLYSLNKIPDYPFVSSRVGGFRYFIMNLLEANNFVFTFAGKRISELDKWGNNMPVVGKIGSVKELKSWWSNQQPEIWQIYRFRKYASWEASLARYVILWEKEIGSIDFKNRLFATEKVMTLKGYLRNHERKMALLLYNSGKPSREKEYLSRLINKIYTDLNRQLNHYIPEYDPGNIRYSLIDLHQDKQYGLYDISLNLEGLSSYLKTNPLVEINNRLLSGKLATDNTIIYPRITINGKTEYLRLKLDATHFQVKNAKWSEIYNSGKKQYQYSLPIPKIPKELTYFLNFRYRFNQPIILQVIKDVKMGKTSVQKAVMSYDLLLSDKKNVLNESLTLADNDGLNYYLLLIAYEPLSALDLESVSVDFQPFLDPEIIMEKVTNISQPTINYRKIDSFKYSIGIQNSTLENDLAVIDSLYPWWQIKSRVDISSGTDLLVEYWPASILMIGIISFSFLWLLLFYYWRLKRRNKISRLPFVNRLMFSLKRNIVKSTAVPLLKLHYRFLKFIKKFRLVFLIFFLLIFLTDMLGTGKQNIFIIVFAAICWIIGLIGYSLETKSSFIITIALLSLCTFSTIFNNAFFTEKLAIWSYIFLIISITQALWELKPENMKISKVFSLKTISPEIGQDILPIAIGISRIIRKQKTAFSKLPKHIAYDFESLPFWHFFWDPLYEKLFQKIISFYKPKSKNKNDRLRSAYRLVITLSIVIFIIAINNHFRYLKDRENLNPVIEKIEPGIVYHSNKIIVKGAGFSWNLDPGEKLMTQYGPVTVSLWTDTKLIFSVPLDWKPGTITLWIEKPSSWDSKKITVKSKAVSIKLIPIKNSMDKEDDEYFEQLKHLDKETLELNGYK